MILFLHRYNAPIVDWSQGSNLSTEREKYGEEEGGITSLFKSLSDIQTRLASKGKLALPEAALTQQELAARAKPTENPFDIYAHLAPTGSK